MDEKKKISKRFEDEMGYKSCNIINKPISDKVEQFGTQKPLINMECKSSSDKAFKCTGLIDINQKKITKSSCEEKNPID